MPFGTPNGMVFYEFNVDANGHLQVDIISDPVISHTTDSIKIGDGTDFIDIIAVGGDNLANTLNQLIVGAYLYGFDSTTGDWDRIRRIWHGDGKANSEFGLVTGAFGYAFNGSTWDRLRLFIATDFGTPDLDAQILLGTHALMSCRLDDTRTVGAQAESDDNIIPQSENHLTVINLNYVDNGAGSWVRMTQP